MRTLNLRLTVICIVTMTILAGAVHLLHTWQMRRHATTFLAAATRAKDEKDLRGAITFMQAYVALRPNDFDAREKLAFWFGEARRFDRSLAILEELLRNPDSEHSDAKTICRLHSELVQVSVKLQRYQDAETHIDFLLKSSPNDPVLLDLKGQCRYVLAYDDDARKLFERAIQLAPHQIETYLRLALVLKRQDKPKEADEVLKSMTDRNPKALVAYIYAGTFYLENGRYQDGLARAKTALELAPTNSNGLYLAGRCLTELGRYDDGADYIKRGIQAAGKDPVMYALMADNRMRAERRDEALIWLEKGLQSTQGSPAYSEILWHLCNLRLDSKEAKDIDEAKRLLEELRKLNYPRQHLDCIDARVDYAQENWAAARVKFETVRPALTDTPALLKYVDFWIGYCYGESESREKQLEAYRRALAIDPFFHPARDGLADILAKNGDLPAAIEEYQNIFNMGRRDEETLLGLARTLVLYYLGKPKDQQNWAKVVEVLELAHQAEEAKFGAGHTNAPLALLMVEVLFAENRMDEAKKVLVELRDADPKVVQFWTALSAFSQRANDWESASKYLDDAQKKLGDNISLRSARAQYLLRRYGDEAAPEIKKLAENADAFSHDDQGRLWNELAALCIQAGDLTTAKHLCEKVARREPHNVKIRYLLFELALRAAKTKDISAILPELETLASEIETISGRGAIWLYCQAVRLTIRSKDAHSEAMVDALGLIAQARILRPNWSRLPLLAGSIYEQSGNMDMAMEEYMRAIKLGESDFGVIRKTLEMLSQRQRYADVDDVLKVLEGRQVPLTADMTREFVDIESQGGNIGRALEIYAKTFDQESKNYGDHLFYGQLLAVQARHAKEAGNVADAARYADRAEKALRRSLAIEPRSPETWVALVGLFAGADQDRKAHETIDAAQDRIPTEYLAIGRCYEAVHEYDKSQAKYAAAIQAAPANVKIIRQLVDFYMRTDRLPEAEPLVRRIVTGEISAKPEEIAWGRRIYALVLASHRTFAELQIAMKLIEANLASSVRSDDDERTKIRLLMLDPRADVRSRAEQEMVKMIKGSVSPPADVRFDLAELYRRRGDWSNYHSLMLGLINSPDCLARYRAGYIRMLLENHENEEAGRQMAVLEKAAPNQFETVELQAELLFEKHDDNAAIETLVGFLDRPGAEPVRMVDRLACVASVLEKFGDRRKAPNQKAVAALFHQKAESLYASLGDQDRSRSFESAAFLARQGKIHEGLEFLRSAAADIPPSALGPIASTMARSEAITPKLIADLDALLDANLKKSGRPVPLLLAMADVRTIQDRYDDAEQFYREALVKNPTNVLALNNLAELIAFSGKRLDEALALVDRAIAVVGPVGAVLDSRAVVYIARQQPDLALKDLELAIADDPKPTRLFHQARAYLLGGDQDKAKDAMGKAKKADIERSMLDPPERAIYDQLRDEL